MWSFTKNKERIQRFKQTVNSRHIYWNKLHKAYVEKSMAYGDSKDIPGKPSDKTLRDKAFHIAKDLKHDGYQRGIASMAL